MGREGIPLLIEGETQNEISLFISFNFFNIQNNLTLSFIIAGNYKVLEISNSYNIISTNLE